MTEKAFACPCCGELTLADAPPGTFDICDVCDWEDDDVQFFDPDYEGGANTRSLNQQRTWHRQNARDAQGRLMFATTMDIARLQREAATHPYPLLFATISGAHLYGFPSPDSDFDLRGVHILPLSQIAGLKDREETITVEAKREGIELDLVTHDVEKFFRMMLKKNGYVLEQLHSPLIVHTTPEHAELKEIARGCVTRFHCHHYFGFAANQWKLFAKVDPPRVKPLLYVYRVLLTGIHLMRTGEIEANLETLNGDARLGFIPELLERKRSGPEKGTLSAAEMEFHAGCYAELVAALEDAAAKSALPEQAQSADALNDLLVRIRLAQRR